jgi:hypothetical protein
MSDESTKEEPENREPKSPTLDQKYITWPRNKRPIALVIVIGAILLSGLKYANDLYDEAVKAWAMIFPAKRTEPATFAVRLIVSVQTDVPLFYIVRGATACATPVLLIFSFTNWVKLPKLAMIQGQQIYADTPKWD